MAKQPAQGNGLQATTYYGRLERVCAGFPDVNAKRNYVGAVRKAFDRRDGAPLAPHDIAEQHALNRGRLHEYRLMLTKRHIQEFLCEELDYPGATIQSIRDIQEDVYEKRFKRKPFVRGRSSYWFTLAEWLTLLDLVGEFPLPGALEDIAKKQGL